MKILFISESTPFESSTGSYQRTNLLLQSIREFAEVDVFCVNASKSSVGRKRLKNDAIQVLYWGRGVGKTNRLVDYFKRFYSYVGLNPYAFFGKNRSISLKLKDIIQEKAYDFIVVRYLPFAVVCGLDFNKKLVIDVDDLPEQYYLSRFNQASNPIKRLHYYLYYQFSKRYTRQILRRIGHSFFPNPTQALYPHSSYLPNIPFPRNIEGKHNATENIILFVGFMVWPPNFEGVDFFLSHCWKTIKETISDVVFKIAGKGLPETYREKWKTYEGVEVLGFVEDLDDLYCQSKMVIAPIYSGAGTNIKVLEAMRYGCATLISDHASRGFENYLKDGENVLIASTADEFSQKAILLLTNSALNQKISSQGKKCVDEHFSFDAFKRIVYQALN